MAESLRKPSGTAVLTAVARGLHREEGSAAIFDDDLAFALAGDEGAPLAGRLRADLAPGLRSAFCRWVCVRSRYTEDTVEAAIRDGVDQYVILGAGLDSFAYRRGDLIDRVRVYEVDHPGSQAWKRRRLDELGIRVPATLVFAPVDFEHNTLRDGLADAGFDLARPAVLSWIGVTMYLTLDAIEATLATIAQCPSGTRVVLTYNQPHQRLDAFAVQVTDAFRSIATGMGEPFVTLLVPEEVDEMLGRHGFVDVAHFGADDARRTYFAGQADVEIAGAQMLVTATRA